MCAPGKGSGNDLTERVISAGLADEDAQYEAGLRPRSLDEYIGQDRLRENLRVSIDAARRSITSCFMVRQVWERRRLPM
jgi:hypothetical protein